MLFADKNDFTPPPCPVCGSTRIRVEWDTIRFVMTPDRVNYLPVELECLDCRDRRAAVVFMAGIGSLPVAVTCETCDRQIFYGTMLVDRRMVVGSHEHEVRATIGLLPGPIATRTFAAREPIALST